MTRILEGTALLGREDWENATEERILLTWMANDVKIIGQCDVISANKQIKTVRNSLTYAQVNCNYFQRQLLNRSDNL